MNNLNLRLKECRLSHSLNQTELAKIMDVTKQTVSNWEKGSRIPNTSMLLKLSEFYNVSTDYLLGRTNNPKAYKYIDTDGSYSLIIDGKESHNISPEVLSKLMDKLKSVGFDVSYLLKDIAEEVSKEKQWS